MTTNHHAVEAACTHLAQHGEAITFTAIADHTSISRTTLYHNPQLRAEIEEHHSHSHHPHTLTGLANDTAHLRTGLQALTDRDHNQQERHRHLESRTTTPRHRKAN